MTNCLFLPSNCLSGGIGRRAAFKIHFWINQSDLILMEFQAQLAGNIGRMLMNPTWQDRFLSFGAK